MGQTLQPGYGLIITNGDSFPTPQSRFRENASLNLLPADQVPKIVPSAAAYRPGNGSLFIKEDMEIASSKSLSAEADFLAATLEPIGDRRCVQKSDCQTTNHLARCGGIRKQGPLGWLGEPLGNNRSCTSPGTIR